MSTDTDEIPFFPATAPEVLSRPQETLDLVTPVLRDLATMVAGITPEQLDRPTPCARYDVAAHRDHVLGWLQFFAAAMNDPRRETVRIEPDSYRAADDDRDLADVVRGCAARVEQAIRAGVQLGDVVMSQSRMAGPAVLGMFLGEYAVHGWDLARATGQPWSPPEQSCEVALEFFTAMIAPEYRGGDAGFFGAEIAVPDDAPALDRLLGFAGRDPAWTPPAA